MIRKALESSFPKACRCGRVYQNELDYLICTEPTPQGMALDYRELESVLFSFRNCKCRSITGLELFGKMPLPEMNNLFEELHQEAKKNKITSQQMLDQFNQAYIAWRLAKG